MTKQLSILIPVYNDSAANLVAALLKQADTIDDLEYEIVVYDDGSTDEKSIKTNEVVCQQPHCRFHRGRRSRCRAAMRNAMQLVACYDWRLMIDSRLSPRDTDFLRCYVDAISSEPKAVVGGVEIALSTGTDMDKMMKSNLRYKYEKHEERNHSLQARQSKPYHSLRTTNILYHRNVLQQVAYDETIIGYGYEDVKLGCDMQKAGICIQHIDNPVVYSSFEDNVAYINKMEEAMRTLYSQKDQLRDFSPLLSVINKLRNYHLLGAIRLWHWLFSSVEKNNLVGSNPSLLLFKLYKLGYLSSLYD